MLPRSAASVLRARGVRLWHDAVKLVLGSRNQTDSSSKTKRVSASSFVRHVGQCLLLAAIFLAAIQSTTAQPSVNSVTSVSGDDDTHTVSHTTAGTDRLLTVCVVNDDTAVAVTDVTFDGSSLSKLTDVQHSGGKPRVEVWYSLNPPVKTANVVVTLASGKKTTIGVISLTGVDQSTPIDGTTTNTGSTSPATVSVTSASGDLVIDCMGTIPDPTEAPKVGSNQTEQWTLEEGGSIRGGGSTEPGGSSVTMSWTLPEDKDWASIGFNVNAASAAGFTVTESGGSTSVAESGTTDTFTVVLDAAPASNVVILVSSGDTGEATVDVSSLTFTTATWNTAQTVTVTGVDEDLTRTQRSPSRSMMRTPMMTTIHWRIRRSRRRRPTMMWPASRWWNQAVLPRWRNRERPIPLRWF